MLLTYFLFFRFNSFILFLYLLLTSVISLISSSNYNINFSFKFRCFVKEVVVFSKLSSFFLRDLIIFNDSSYLILNSDWFLVSSIKRKLSRDNFSISKIILVYEKNYSFSLSFWYLLLFCSISIFCFRDFTLFRNFMSLFNSSEIRFFNSTTLLLDLFNDSWSSISKLGKS